MTDETNPKPALDKTEQEHRLIYGQMLAMRAAGDCEQAFSLLMAYHQPSLEKIADEQQRQAHLQARTIVSRRDSGMAAIERDRMLKSQQEYVESLERFAGSEPDYVMKLLKLASYADIVKHIADLKTQTQDLEKQFAHRNEEDAQRYEEMKKEYL